MSDDNAAGEAPTGERRVWRLRGGAFRETDDCLVTEEPLEIRVNDRRFTVTMRTPGEDFALTRGLLFAEGVITSDDDIGHIRYCDVGDTGETDAPNLIAVQLRSAPASPERQWQRNLISGTSCGLCGKAAIEAVACAAVSPLKDADDGFDIPTLLRLPDLLRQRQAVFSRTGGLHAAALFGGDGVCRASSEDIGRHNATDKVIGRGLREGWLPWDPAAGTLALLVSGRASFEITQKALMARIPVVCSISAASTLAVDLAHANRQTLIGFLRETGMTVYTGRHRVRGMETDLFS